MENFNLTDFKNIKKNLDDKGYAIINNVFTHKELENCKKRLLDILHYIHPKKISDLNKKYFQVKNYNMKLKGNFFDMLQHEVSVLKLLNKNKITDIVRKYFNS